MAHFLRVRVQVLWPIRVSRYKVDREQVTSQGTQFFIAGTGAVALQTITKLSREQEQIAKSVTNK